MSEKLITKSERDTLRKFSQMPVVTRRLLDALDDKDAIIQQLRCELKAAQDYIADCQAQDDNAGKVPQ